ncbi:MAG TPA: hypothetical protein VMV44_00245 [Rectinemataceae bacterium]|nr:hypothetical protein [Rectinemataceae bacterium]
MTGMLATSAVPLTYAFVAQSGGGRVSLPVAPSQVLYANFAHVSGIAASPGEPVATIDRLKILDTLIERLSRMKSEPLAASEKPEDMSSERIDALIQQYGSELRSKAVATSVPYSHLVPVESGMLFSLAA